jgi:hypothetical protein
MAGHHPNSSEDAINTHPNLLLTNIPHASVLFDLHSIERCVMFAADEVSNQA